MKRSEADFLATEPLVGARGRSPQKILGKMYICGANLAIGKGWLGARPKNFGGGHDPRVPPPGYAHVDVIVLL